MASRFLSWLWGEKTPQSKILLKIHTPDDEIRTMKVDRSIAYSDLIYEISEIRGYGAVTLKYYDGDDWITIRANEDLQEAFEFFEEGQQQVRGKTRQCLDIHLETALQLEFRSPSSANDGVYSPVSQISSGLESLYASPEAFLSVKSMSSELELQNYHHEQQYGEDEEDFENDEVSSNRSTDPLDNGEADADEEEVAVAIQLEFENQQIHQTIAWFRSSYNKCNLIGSGSFGSVWRYERRDGADEGQLPRQVAVKVVGCHRHGCEHGHAAVHARTAQQIRALQNEVNTVYSKLHHANIVECYGWLDFDCSIHVMLEYLPRGSIRHLYQEGFKQGLPIPMVTKYVREILNGLIYLHAAGLVHRDLKCDNVLLDDDGQCKLVDFGCSKQLQDALVRDGEPRQGKPTFCGTLQWIAPEVLLGGAEPDWKKCDVWALGCTMIEMLTAEPPWQSVLSDAHKDNNNALMFELRRLFRNGHSPPQHKYAERILQEDVLKQTESFLTGCLQHESASRPSAEQLGRHLDELMQLFKPH